MKTQLKLLLIFSSTVTLFGFEVNTHQALTRCAISTNAEACQTTGTQNLETFVNNTGLTSNLYGNENFEDYGETYEKYIEGKSASNFQDWNIKIYPDYRGMVEAGVVLEDSVYPHEDHAGDGRFNNHFYAAQIPNTKEVCKEEGAPFGPMADYRDMKSTKAVCGGYATRTDNIDWVFNKNVDVKWKSNSRKNDYGMDDAFKYFTKSFQGDVANRRKNQAKLFVTLGFMVHMLQDLHSPAHVRDAAHANGDYLEIYGRYDRAFNLKGGKRNSTNNRDIEKAIRDYNMKDIMTKQNKYVSYEDFFRHEANWISKNFFSEAHGIGSDLITGFRATGLIKDSQKRRNTSIFDGYNLHPSRSEVDDQTVIENSKTGTFGNDRWFYLQTYRNLANERGNIKNGHNVVAFIEKGHLGGWPTMMEVTQAHKPLSKYENYNKRALADTAINVMPRAVASTQAFINFFFRGQMEASLSSDHTKLVIKNVSDKDLVYDKKLLTFKRGGKFRVYYQKKDGTNIFLNSYEYSLASDLVVGGTQNIDIGDAINRLNLAEGTKVTVVYDGNIGDDMGGYNQYGIGMRGLSADVFEMEAGICEDKRLKEELELVKKWLKADNRRHCIYFSSLNAQLNRKHIYYHNWKDRKCEYASNYYKNTAITGGISGGPYTRLHSERLVDYFNYNIYKLNTDEDTPNEVYTASAVKNPYYVPNSGNFNVSYQIRQIKDNDEVRNISLPNLLYYNYKPANGHINSPHYHVTCHANSKICNYLKFKNISDVFIELSTVNIAAQDFLSSPRYPARVADRISFALADYYGKDYGKSYTQNQYPKDWLKKIVDWVEQTDCKTVSQKNIFYDEAKIHKSGN